MIDRLNKTQQGITLIEVLVTMAIITMIASMVSFLGLDISDFQLFFGENLEIQQELALTLRVLAGEMRAMGTADHGGYPIAAASSSSITFYSDLGGNNKLEQVRYFLDGTTFKKGVIASSGVPPEYPPGDEVVQEVVHNITSTNIFKYHDENYTGSEAPLPSPVDVSKIRLIKIILTVDRDPLQPPGPTTGTVNTTLRNLRIVQ